MNPRRGVDAEMLRKMKFLLVVLVVTLALAPLSNVMAEKQKVSIAYAPLHYIYDGKEYIPPEDQQGFLYKYSDRYSSTYVPVRFAAYMIDKWVDWDPETHTVIVRDPTRDEAIEITDINLNAIVRESHIVEADHSKIKYHDIEAITNVKFEFDGELVQPPAEQPGLIINGRTFVPLRFFSESFGIQIEWDGPTYSVIAMSEAYVAELARIEEELGEAVDLATLLPGVRDPSSSNKPSSSSLITAAEAQIAALKSKALSYFLTLLSQYNHAEQAEKERIIASAEAKLAQFDEEFAFIMEALASQLELYDYDTAVIASYEEQYAEEKRLARSFIGM